MTMPSILMPKAPGVSACVHAPHVICVGANHSLSLSPLGLVPLILVVDGVGN